MTDKTFDKRMEQLTFEQKVTGLASTETNGGNKFVCQLDLMTDEQVALMLSYGNRSQKRKGKMLLKRAMHKR